MWRRAFLLFRCELMCFGLLYGCVRQVPLIDKKMRCKQLVISFKKLFRSTESERYLNSVDYVSISIFPPQTCAGCCQKVLDCPLVYHLWYSMMLPNNLPLQWPRSHNLLLTTILLVVLCPLNHCRHPSSPSMPVSYTHLTLPTIYSV